VVSSPPPSFRQPATAAPTTLQLDARLVRWPRESTHAFARAELQRHTRALLFDRQGSGRKAEGLPWPCPAASVICMVWCLHSTSTPPHRNGRPPLFGLRPGPWQNLTLAVMHCLLPSTSPSPSPPLPTPFALSTHTSLTGRREGTVPGVRPCPSMRYWSATVGLVVCL
jgi:hypothetical protein